MGRRPALFAVLGALATAAFALFPGCSLTGLSDLEIPLCVSHDQCAPLNDRDGIDPEACRLFQCIEGACVFSPRDQDLDSLPPTRCAEELPECAADLRCIDCNDDDNTVGDAPEVCDGADNDCDFVVDEDVTRQDPAAPLTPLVSPAGGIAPDNVAGVLDGSGLVRYGQRLDGLGVGVSFVGEDGAAFLAPSAAGAESPPEMVEFVTSAMLGDAAFGDLTFTSGCYRVGDEPVNPPPGSPIVDADPPRTCATHAECDDGVTCNGYEQCVPGGGGTDAFGCRPGTPACTGAETTCDEATGMCRSLTLSSSCTPRDLASAEIADSRWLAATVTTDGCSSGRVAIGYLTENGPSMNGADPGPNVLLRGDGRRSTSFVGVDVGADQCTGASRGAGEPVGAAAINTAGLEADEADGSARLRPQGLVTWLAAPLCRSAADDTERAACATDETAAVEVIGVFLEGDGSGDTAFEWINATGDGLPQRLPEPTGGHAPPALASVSTAAWAGYVVAYGHADGGLVVHTIGAMADPAEVQSIFPYRSPIESTDPTRTTAPLAQISAALVLPGGGGASAAVDRVQMMASTQGDASAVTLGLSWVEADGVWFATLTIDTSTGMPQIAAGALEPIKLGDAADVTSLGLGYASTGFFTEDPTRLSEALGGWYAMWIERGEGVFARRVGERDGAAIGVQPAALSTDTRLSNVGAAFIGPAGAEARPRVIAHRSGGANGSGFVLFPGVCAPAPLSPEPAP